MFLPFFTVAPDNHADEKKRHKLFPCLACPRGTRSTPCNCLRKCFASLLRRVGYVIPILSYIFQVQIPKCHEEKKYWKEILYTQYFEESTFYLYFVHLPMLF